MVNYQFILTLFKGSELNYISAGCRARDHLIPRCYFLYRRSTVTESLSPAIVEMGHKHFSITSLILQGHVTSSITLLFDLPCAISYWWSIGTELLSPTVLEIFGKPLVCARTHRQTHAAGDFILCPM